MRAILACLTFFLSTAAIAADLVPLPRQPEGVPWPTLAWPRSAPDASVDGDAVDAHGDYAFDPSSAGDLGETRALLVVHRGKLVVERYAPGFGPDRRFHSQSITKSIVHALVGILVRQKTLDLDAPAPVAAWQRPNDPRRDITLRHLMTMSSGLAFTESYFNPFSSDVLPMLFGEARGDIAAHAASYPLMEAPGTHWSYSSGTTNLVSGLVRQAVGDSREGYLNFMRRELFVPLGMTSALPEFDARGTFVGSSFLHATPRDFARFGLLYLRDGLWNGRRIFPEGWVDFARTPLGHESRGIYGAHFWLNAGRPHNGVPRLIEHAPPDMFMARGHRGQLIAVVPSKDLVLVRFGRTPYSRYGSLFRWMGEVVGAFPDVKASPGEQN